MPPVPSLPPLPIVRMQTNLYVFNFLSLRCIGLFTVNKLKDACRPRLSFASSIINSLASNKVSTYSNIRAGSIQREYYLFLEISNMLLSR